MLVLDISIAKTEQEMVVATLRLAGYYRISALQDLVTYETWTLKYPFPHIWHNDWNSNSKKRNMPPRNNVT